MTSWQNILSSGAKSTPFINVNISNETKLLIEGSSANNSNTIALQELELKPPQQNTSNSHILETSKEPEPLKPCPLGSSTLNTPKTEPLKHNPPNVPKVQVPEVSEVATKNPSNDYISRKIDPPKVTAQFRHEPSAGTSKIHKPQTPQKIEPSKQNPLLMNVIQRQPMAKYWDGENYKPYVLRNIQRRSSEFRRVSHLFRLSNRGLSIRKLQRIENPFLLGQYLLKREDMYRRNLPVRERLLFHGTTNSCVKGICSVNFDWRLYGQARGHKYGHGVCFSPEVSYASKFGQNVMILTRVLVAKTTIGDSDTVIPPEHFDTTRNDKGTVLVKYEDAEYYPEYVIRYGRNHSRNVGVVHITGMHVVIDNSTITVQDYNTRRTQFVITR